MILRVALKSLRASRKIRAISMAMINRIFSHYHILEELGKGAMGAVYLAEDTSLARQVAIKFADQTRDDQEFRARFQREARLAASLNHRNIATVYDFGEINGAHRAFAEFFQNVVVRNDSVDHRH